jgi:hypothetical protein
MPGYPAVQTTLSSKRVNLQSVARFRMGPYVVLVGLNRYRCLRR